MSLLSPQDQAQVRALLAERLLGPVTLEFYTQRASPLSVPAHQCETCRETGELLSELASLSDRLGLEVHDFVLESEAARQQGIDRIPAVILKGKNRGVVRYFGIPAGYEFASLLEDLLDVSRGTTSLAPASRERLAGLSGKVHLEVLVTPT